MEIGLLLLILSPLLIPAIILGVESILKDKKAKKIMFERGMWK